MSLRKPRWKKKWPAQFTTTTRTGTRAHSLTGPPYLVITCAASMVFLAQPHARNEDEKTSDGDGNISAVSGAARGEVPHASMPLYDNPRYSKHSLPSRSPFFGSYAYVVILASY